MSGLFPWPGIPGPLGRTSLGLSMWLPQRQQGLRSSGKSSQSLKSCGLIYNPGEHLQDFLRLPHLSGPWSQHLMKMGLRESSQAGGGRRLLGGQLATGWPCGCPHQLCAFDVSGLTPLPSLRTTLVSKKHLPPPCLWVLSPHFLSDVGPLQRGER